MRFLVFENNKSEVIGAFEGLELFHYPDKELNCDFMVKSQQLGVFTQVLDYDLVFVDLHLAPDSEMDGYGIIKSIQQLEGHPPVLIITGIGRKDVEEQMKARGLEEVEVLIKPFDDDELDVAMKKAISRHNKRQV